MNSSQTVKMSAELRYVSYVRQISNDKITAPGFLETTKSLKGGIQGCYQSKWLRPLINQDRLDAVLRPLSTDHCFLDRLIPFYIHFFFLLIFNIDINISHFQHLIATPKSYNKLASWCPWCHIVYFGQDLTWPDVKQYSKSMRKRD